MQTSLRDRLFPQLSPTLAEQLQKLKESDLEQLEEIRIRVSRPIYICVNNRWRLLESSWIPESADCDRLFSALCEQSPYAREEEVRAGFLTLRGGFRVGLSGQVRMHGGLVQGITHVTGFALRIARAAPGCADAILPHITKAGRVLHTLILSPPGQGKTTLLRDIARQLGARYSVVVIDERSEIAGCHRGVPQLDVGMRTDVLDGCPKALGIDMALRAMAPDVLIMDEIGLDEDVRALENALRTGVAVVASAHGDSVAALRERSVLRACLAAGGFERFIVLGRGARGALERIEDARGTVLRAGR